MESERAISIVLVIERIGTGTGACMLKCFNASPTPVVA
jgi:hypothetical protein